MTWSRSTQPVSALPRRLLTTKEVAAKLGFSVNWMYRAGARLSAMGFPAPVMGGGAGRPARYDEAAIDRWMDRQMPADLRGDGTDATLSRDLGARLEALSNRPCPPLSTNGGHP